LLLQILLLCPVRPLQLYSSRRLRSFALNEERKTNMNPSLRT
jgi:hypothetical protein